MEKVLEIDLEKEEDFFECYNKKKVSRELIQYMVDSVPRLTKDDTLKVIINNKIKGNIKCSELIKQALDEACAKNDFRFHISNMRQIWFLLIGILALVIASLIQIEILKEVVIIGAWVLLWDAVEIEIIDDISNRKKKRILKKILSSEFVEILK